jgi:propanol-preferring alcohol dehydrogenase
MRAMLLDAPGQRLRPAELPIPEPASGQVLIRVGACGVCRTDLHIADGELTGSLLPLIPGHEIVGRIVRAGPGVDPDRVGERIGVPWLGYSCGECRYCLDERENLCDRARFTGYNFQGGYAEYTVADQRFCFPLAGGSTDAEAAPLLCAGLIGYRSYRMTGKSVRNLGIYGFGAAAHIIAQVAIAHGKHVFAFTSPGDEKAQSFARNLGAVWAGDSTGMPPEELDAAIIFAPVGALIPAALKATAKGGTVVCGGIHMSDIPSFPYQLLWGERVVRSVANLTRTDGVELLSLAPAIPLRTQVQVYPLKRANEALADLRGGRVQGAAVIVMKSSGA